MSITGTCLCGAIAFEVSGAIEPGSHCHCSMCRKSHGAPFATYVHAKKRDFRYVRGEADIAGFQSSAAGVRSFCPRCGSSLPIVPDSLDLVFIPAGLVQEALELPQMPHLFAASKAPWYTIRDAARQFETYPPGWGEPAPYERKTEPVPNAARGSCLCGAVAYELKRPIEGGIVFCHCSRCRRARAAAHNANLFLPAAQFAFLRGSDNIAFFKLPEAERFGQAFCRTCSSPTPVAGAARATVPAATLDDDPGVRPLFHIFLSAKAPWYPLSDADPLPRHETYPPGGLFPTTPAR